MSTSDKPKRPIAQRGPEPRGNVKVDGYDAAVLCIEHCRASLACIRTMLDSDLWPNSADAFEAIFENQIAECDEALERIKALDPSE
ncbi:MAG TPA: hypothetical protein VKR31_07190 [Rhizomicrobium sp.]|nr:hypothetical protein [Rhizomicrobium sp.]